MQIENPNAYCLSLRPQGFQREGEGRQRPPTQVLCSPVGGLESCEGRCLSWQGLNQCCSAAARWLQRRFSIQVVWVANPVPIESLEAFVVLKICKSLHGGRLYTIRKEKARVGH